MTQTNTTPTGDANQPEVNAEPIDNMGNPVNEDGTPREESKPAQDNTETPSVESLEKALKDTKAELTRLQQGKAETKDEEPQEKAPEDNLQIQEKKAEDAGINMSKYSDEYNDDGSLSEDSYKELEAKGLDKNTVDAYIEGRKALASQQADTLMGSVGGEESFNQVIEWAGENLSEAEVNTYNKLVQNGEMTQAALVLKGIKAQYTEANGSAPKLMSGDVNSPTGDTYKSQHDMVNAMSDKRYGKDPDYTQEVQEKAARSHKAGTI